MPGPSNKWQLLTNVQPVNFLRIDMWDDNLKQTARIQRDNNGSPWKDDGGVVRTFTLWRAPAD